MRGLNPIMLLAVSLITLTLCHTVWAVEQPPMIWNPAYSGNYTTANRPVSSPIEYVVIHITEGSYAGAISWFKNSASKVSAHYVISKTGEITNMVKHKDIAWHAGNWTYNERGIGIEHEGTGADPNSWTEAQLSASAWLTAWICETYGIPVDSTRIKLHKEVRDTACPGVYFNRTSYLSRVNSHFTTPYDAASTNVQAPSVMTSGEEAVVTLEFRNTGSTTWDTNNTRLYTNPFGRNSAFYPGYNWLDAMKPTKLDSPASVSNGGTGVFAFVVKAPTVAGVTDFVEKFQLGDLRNANGTVFGPIITLTIRVHPAAAPAPAPAPDPEPGPAGGAKCAALPDGSNAAGWWMLVVVVGLAMTRRRANPASSQTCDPTSCWRE